MNDTGYYTYIVRKYRPKVYGQEEAVVELPTEHDDVKLIVIEKCLAYGSIIY